MIKEPSPISAVKAHRLREEQRAFQNYARALRNWERTRERADDLAWQLEIARAELQQKVLAGCTSAQAAALQLECRHLEEKHSCCERECRQAKHFASASFTALAAARNARIELERKVDDALDGSNIVCLPVLNEPALDTPLLHLN